MQSETTQSKTGRRPPEPKATGSNPVSRAPVSGRPPSEISPGEGGPDRRLAPDVSRLQAAGGEPRANRANRCESGAPVRSAALKLRYWLDCRGRVAQGRAGALGVRVLGRTLSAAIRDLGACAWAHGAVGGGR